MKIELCCIFSVLDVIYFKDVVKGNVILVMDEYVYGFLLLLGCSVGVIGVKIKVIGDLKNWWYFCFINLYKKLSKI